MRCSRSTRRRTSSILRASITLHFRSRGISWSKVLRRACRNWQTCKRTSLKRSTTGDRTSELRIWRTRRWNSNSATKPWSIRRGKNSSFSNNHSLLDLIIWKTKVKSLVPWNCSKEKSVTTSILITLTGRGMSTTTRARSSATSIWFHTTSWLTDKNASWTRTRSSTSIGCFRKARKL